MSKINLNDVIGILRNGKLSFTMEDNGYVDSIRAIQVKVSGVTFGFKGNEEALVVVDYDMTHEQKLGMLRIHVTEETIKVQSDYMGTVIKGIDTDNKVKWEVVL